MGTVATAELSKLSQVKFPPAHFWRMGFGKGLEVGRTRR